MGDFLFWLWIVTNWIDFWLKNKEDSNLEHSGTFIVDGTVHDPGAT